MPLKVVSSGRAPTVKLRNMAKRAQDLSKVWPKIGAYLSRVASRQFTTSGKFLSAQGFPGKAWQPLQPSYLKRKTAQGYSRRPLIKTGALRAEFVGRPMLLERYGKTTAVYGSTSDLANWHHRGTRYYNKKSPNRGRIHIPARPILYTTPMVKKDISAMFRAHIVGKTMAKGAAKVRQIK